MASSKKIRVAVLYGGRSGEHEVALRSAASVIRNLDRDRFDIVPIAVDKAGRWLLHDLKTVDQAGASLPILKDAPEVLLPPYPMNEGAELIPLNFSGGSEMKIDVVFPVMHGPLCEDGTIQGILELADVAYVGCGVLSSAVGMDKDVAKRLVRDAGLPIVPFVCLRKESWKKNVDRAHEHISRELGFPVFVKPSNMGSSVGVHKVKEASHLRAALEDAFKYDTKVLVERAIQAREIEIAVLENPIAGEPPLVTIPGEIAPTHEFYSYEAKYIDDNGAELMIPAKMNQDQIAAAQRLAREAFQALECEGMARADLFLDRKTGAFYFNEVNTIPGFTSISMYPKLWEATGIPYSELLSRLVDLAIERRKRKHALSREYQA